MRRWGTLFCAALVACGQSKVDLPPSAIVSTSLCADGYVHAFSDIQPRLAALSWQSRSELSSTPEPLRSLPQADSDPERALMWKDAILISSAGGPGDIDLSWGEDFDVVWKNLKSLSNAFNLPDPSNDLQARLGALEMPKERLKILYLDRSGATAGPQTFVDEVITVAGAENIVRAPGWQSPDIEVLMKYDPDIILTSFMDSEYSGVNDRALRHEALAEKIESVPQIKIPGKYWPCAGPGLVEAAEHLSEYLLAL